MKTTPLLVVVDFGSMRAVVVDVGSVLSVTSAREVAALPLEEDAIELKKLIN